MSGLVLTCDCFRDELATELWLGMLGPFRACELHELMDYGLTQLRLDGLC